MKKRIVVAVVTGILFSVMGPAFAGSDEKGANEQAVEHASDQAVFHRVSDWFSTVGKGDEEKKVIREKKKAERASRKAEKQAKEKQKKADRELKKLKEQAGS